MRDRHASLKSIKIIMVSLHMNYFIYIFIFMPRGLLHFTKSARALMHVLTMRTYLTLISVKRTRRNFIEHSTYHPSLISACRDTVALNRQLGTEESVYHILEGAHAVVDQG